MITAIDAIPGNEGTASVKRSDALGKEDFLQLLVAQLQAQDPLSPMDAQDFSAQLAQFSALEQMSNVNVNLEKIHALEISMANTSALDLIGRNVDAPGNNVIHNKGESHTLRYSLENNASVVQVDIFDSFGNRVASVGLNDQNAGNNRVIWNGSDSLGNPLEKGIYSFRVEARTAEGNAVGTSTLAEGQVTEVLFDEGQAFAIVNGEKLPVNQITRIRI
jgi:flagellar basal-body rod modification protein FlgD